MNGALNLKFNPFPEIETERLYLRRLSADDAPVIFRLRSDPSVNEYVNRPLAKVEEDALNFINSINEGIDRNGVFYWGISLKDKKQLIGTICVWNISPNDAAAEIGYELLPEFQGRGYVTESIKFILDFAFREVGLTAMYAYVHPLNERSIKVLDKSGFNFIGKAEDGEEVIYKKDKTEIQNI